MVTLVNCHQASQHNRLWHSVLFGDTWVQSIDCACLAFLSPFFAGGWRRWCSWSTFTGSHARFISTNSSGEPARTSCFIINLQWQEAQGPLWSSQRFGSKNGYGGLFARRIIWRNLSKWAQQRRWRQQAENNNQHQIWRLGQRGRVLKLQWLECLIWSRTQQSRKIQWAFGRTSSTPPACP